MQGPHTLKEYLQRKTLQRKNEFVLLNEAKNIPNPISLDKDRKIDALIIDILEYVRHLIGDGPLFNRLQMMMEHLHKTFSRELSEFHQVTVYNKLKHDEKHLDEIRKANDKLGQYVKQCEKEKEEADLKLQKLVNQNKGFRVGQKNKEGKYIVDNFDDQEVVQKVTKVQKIGKIDINSGSHNKNGAKQPSGYVRSDRKWQIKL